MKAIVDFEVKLVEYAAALREYNVLHAEFHDTEQRAAAEFCLKRLIAAEKRLDKLRGPMQTALNKMALAVV